MRTIFGVMASAILCASLAPPSQAAWTLIENFNALNLGGLDTQNGWTVTHQPASISVVSDPSSEYTNRALRIQNQSTAEVGAYKALGAGIPEGSTATVFLRVRNATSSADLGFGATSIAEPTSFGSFDAQALTTNGNLNVRNGSTAPTTINLKQYGGNIWTNVWMVIDNAADTTTIYSTTGNAAATGTPSVVGAFRNGAIANPLLNFQVRSAASQLSAAYIDDIYLDLSGTNLTRPTLVTATRGDVNGDGVVNSVDLGVIQTNYNQSVLLRSEGDLNSDGIVDIYDFREWKDLTLFGSGGGAIAFAVPEPSGLTVVAVGLLGLSWRRRRSKYTLTDSPMCA